MKTGHQEPSPLAQWSFGRLLWKSIQVQMQKYLQALNNNLLSECFEQQIPSEEEEEEEEGPAPAQDVQSTDRRSD